jgi:hypothetical protein
VGSRVKTSLFSGCFSIYIDSSAVFHFGVRNKTGKYAGTPRFPQNVIPTAIVATMMARYLNDSGAVPCAGATEFINSWHQYSESTRLFAPSVIRAFVTFSDNKKSYFLAH